MEFNNINEEYLRQQIRIELIEPKIDYIYNSKDEIEFVKVSDYYQLIDYLGVLFKELNIQGDFYEEHNESFESTPIIVHRLVSKQPGASTSASYKDTRRNNDSYHSYMAPIRRSAYRDASNPGTLNVIYTLPRDYIIELIPYSTSTRESNQLAFEIENAITCYRDLIRRQGVSDIIYIGTGEHVIKDVGSTKFVGTPVQLFVRLIQYYEITEEKLLNVYVTTSLAVDAYDMTSRNIIEKDKGE